jgi:hypothetical protein
MLDFWLYKIKKSLLIFLCFLTAWRVPSIVAILKLIDILQIAYIHEVLP